METPLTTKLSAVILAVFANPVIVTAPVAPLMLILDPAAILVTIPVKSAPLTAGNVVGNLPAGTVPTLRLEADMLPSKLVAVMTPVTLISLAPVMLTPPVNVAAVPVIIFSVDATPVSPDPSPEKLVAVMIPLLASRVIAVPTFTTFVNVAAVPVMILSVDATPVNPVPSPTKLVAVITPVRFTLPVPDISFPLTSRFPPSLGVES